MIIGALVTMSFFFAYTEVKSNAQNLGFTCAISFCLVRTPIRYIPIQLLTCNRISTTAPSTPTRPKSSLQHTVALATAFPLA